MRIILSTGFILFSLMVVYAQNVGIAVPVPIGKLHIKVNSTTNLPHLRLTEDENDFARIKMENTTHFNAYWDIAGKSDVNADFSRLNFYFSNPSTGGDRMTIMGNGNVGIGNASPLSKLDIRSIGDGNELLRFTTDRPWVFKQIGVGATAKLSLQSKFDGKKFEILSPDGLKRAGVFYFAGPDAHVYLAPEGGNVGIGTTNPGNKLRVHGSSTSTQHIVSASVNHTDNVNTRAFEGFATPANGYGEGGYFKGGLRGVIAEGAGGNSTNHIVGVFGIASGTGAGIRSGIFGTASGGSKSFAGYFEDGHVYVTNDLRIGIGAIDGTSGYKVAIDGKVIAEEMRVQLSGSWPDYVFDDDYELMSLGELEKEIYRLGHLPGILSAREVEKEGFMLGEMNRMLLEKIEELTLHMIRLEKEIKLLKSGK